MKAFQLEGLNLYITNVTSKEDACLIALACKIGVTPKNLIEVERLPQGTPVYSISSRPSFDPLLTYAIDPFANVGDLFNVDLFEE